jgi:hypothetical protein
MASCSSFNAAFTRRGHSYEECRGRLLITARLAPWTLPCTDKGARYQAYPLNRHAALHCPRDATRHGQSFSRERVFSRGIP